MDLDLSPDHVLLRDTIREFMETEVAPGRRRARARAPLPDGRRHAGSASSAGSGSTSRSAGAAPGMDTLAYAIAVEEIGRVWGSLGLIVAAHTSLGCGPLLIAGTDEQRDRLLPPMASGAVLGAYGLTEPSAGSDAGGTRTTARHEDGADGGTWVIDGAEAVHHERRAGGDIHHHRADGLERRWHGVDLRVHRARRHAGLQRRTPRGEDGPPRLGDRRAAVRRRPRSPTRTSWARRGPASGRSSRCSTAAGSRSARSPSASPRRRSTPPCPTRRSARPVRAADRQLPGRRVHDRGHGDRDRGGPCARLPGRVAQGPGPGLRPRGGRRRSCSRRRSRRG